MSSRWSLTMALVFCISWPAAAAKRTTEFDFRAAVSDPAVLEIFASVIRASNSRPTDRELAAFLIREEDGHVACLPWSYTNQQAAQAYRGPIPEGTVAVFHSHPWSWEKPSVEDIASSRRIGLPIYVLTRDFIYVVDPVSGENVQLVGGQDWSRRLRRSAPAQCRLLPAIRVN